MIETPEPDDMRIDTVAARLGKKRRWLQSRLADDLRKAPALRRLQFHEYIGRTRVWTEIQYQALRAAVKAIDTASRSKSGPAALVSTSLASFALQDKASACAEVQALIAQRLGRPSSPKRSPARP